MQHSLLSLCSAKSLRWLAAGLLSLGLANAASADTPVNAKAPPNDFVSVVANNALNALKAEPSAKAGDLQRINALVNSTSCLMSTWKKPPAWRLAATGARPVRSNRKT